MKPANQLYGLLAEFASSEALVEAARKVRLAGYLRLDALSPFPIPELDEALRLPRSRVPLVFLIGGVLGALTGFGMQVYACCYSYPINVGGRPLYSWPAFIPITFELTVLGAGVIGALGMLAMNGLPHPYHPLFNSPRFDLASQNRFFLCVEARDASFKLEQTRALLLSLAPVSLEEVPV